MIAEVRARSGGPFSVNLFCPPSAVADAAIEAAPDRALIRPLTRRSMLPRPPVLAEIYRSFVEDDAMLGVLLDARAGRGGDFHFGLPGAEAVRALRGAGIVLLATATNPAEELQAIAAAGIDAVVAQGWEAGGHRGMFDPDADDGRMDMMTLTSASRPRERAPGDRRTAGSRRNYCPHSFLEILNGYMRICLCDVSWVSVSIEPKISKSECPVRMVVRC